MLNLDLNVTQMALARGNAYRLFGRLFRRGLTPELLPVVRAFIEMAALPELTLPALSQGLDPDRLAADHYHLFGFNVFPYQSIFLDPESYLGGPVSEAVQEFYYLAGFRAARTNESPDHIGLELSLLAFLSISEADAWEDGLFGEAQRLRRLQRRFLDQHLLLWLPGLAQAIRQQAAPFYASLADLALELALEHRTDLEKDLVFNALQVALPPAPVVSIDGRTSLREIARFLLTPVYSGFYLSRDDIIRLAGNSRLPRGYGSRQQMLANLLCAAAEDQLLPALLESLQSVLQTWDFSYANLREGGKYLSGIAQAWQDRLNATQDLLSRVGKQASMAELVKV